MCVEQDMDRLFENRPDNLILAFDALLTKVIDWEPNSVGASKNAIVFTNQKAWLIVRPMTKELDVKFYHEEPLQNERFKKVKKWASRYAHHIRIQSEEEIDEEMLRLLRIGFECGLR